MRRMKGGKYLRKIIRERVVEKILQLVLSFPLACLRGVVFLGPGLFHLHFQLSQLNGAAISLSVVKNESQQRTQENHRESK